MIRFIYNKEVKKLIALKSIRRKLTEVLSFRKVRTEPIPICEQVCKPIHKPIPRLIPSRPKMDYMNYNEMLDRAYLTIAPIELVVKEIEDEMIASLREEATSAEYIKILDRGLVKIRSTELIK